MLQLKRSALHCKIGKKRLLSLNKSVRLARGYRHMAALNSFLAEESITSDNDALTAGEQILTECE
ncbi:MAG: hypothetical protein KIG65_01835 [Eubacteriales bacterium]|nr:hypothetical protein [Eubacteriales bacterium]